MYQSNPLIFPYLRTVVAVATLISFLLEETHKKSMKEVIDNK